MMDAELYGPNNRHILRQYQCAWCSQPLSVQACGATDLKCSAAVRLTRVMDAMNRHAKSSAPVAHSGESK